MEVIASNRVDLTLLGRRVEGSHHSLTRGEQRRMRMRGQDREGVVDALHYHPCAGELGESLCCRRVELRRAPWVLGPRVEDLVCQNPSKAGISASRRPSSGGRRLCIGAKQNWKTAMDDEVANAGKTSRANLPWLAAYPAGVPARIETPPYGRDSAGPGGAQARGPGVYHHHAERNGSKPELRAS
jgi:hypothetical protein